MWNKNLKFIPLNVLGNGNDLYTAMKALIPLNITIVTKFTDKKIGPRRAPDTRNEWRRYSVVCIPRTFCRSWSDHSPQQDPQVTCEDLDPKSWMLKRDRLQSPKRHSGLAFQRMYHHQLQRSLPRQAMLLAIVGLSQTFYKPSTNWLECVRFEWWRGSLWLAFVPASGVFVARTGLRKI